MTREVTEWDFRQPKFRDANPADYEFREDGAIVRKDRWQTAIYRIQHLLGDTRREFEVDDTFAAVKALVAAIEAPNEVLS